MWNHNISSSKMETWVVLSFLFNVCWQILVSEIPCPKILFHQSKIDLSSFFLVTILIWVFVLGPSYYLSSNCRYLDFSIYYLNNDSSWFKNNLFIVFKSKVYIMKWKQNYKYSRLFKRVERSLFVPDILGTVKAMPIYPSRTTSYITLNIAMFCRQIFNTYF